MAVKLFGFTFGKDEEPIDKRTQAFATPISDDGASTVQAGGYFGTYSAGADQRGRIFQSFGPSPPGH